MKIVTLTLNPAVDKNTTVDRVVALAVRGTAGILDQIIRAAIVLLAAKDGKAI